MATRTRSGTGTYRNQRRFYKGVPVVSGIAIGRVHLKFRQTQVLSDRVIDREDVEGELGRLHEAIRLSKTQLMEARRQVADQVGEVEASIFDTHIAMLEDPVFIGKIRQSVEHDLRPVEVVVSVLVEGYYKALSMVEDANLRERAADIRDVGLRLMNNLHLFHLGGKAEEAAHDDELKGDILFSRDLLPSDVSTIERASVIGVVTESGSGRGHCAVLLRALNIPCVMGVDGIAENIHDGDLVIVDGANGSVFVNPRPNILRSYEKARDDYQTYITKLHAEAREQGRTKDGMVIRVLSNFGNPHDADHPLLPHLDGIGLLRTEIAMMMASAYPDEESQYQQLRAVVKLMDTRPITIRTMDLGYDKQLPYMTLPAGDNSALGRRSLRLAMEMEDYQLIQIKAILRAAVFGDVRLLFPFVTSVEDIRYAKRLVRTAQRQLQEEHKRYKRELPIGMMIEVPVVAYNLPKFAREVQFFSIGTNDLIQYLCAADRNNPDLAPWYKGHNPGVLHALEHIVGTCNLLNRDVSVCGEMAGDPLYTMFLLGIGVTNFSMSMPQVPLIKKVIRSVDLHDAQRMAQRALSLATGTQVYELFKTSVEQILGDELGHWTTKLS